MPSGPDSKEGRIMGDKTKGVPLVGRISARTRSARVEGRIVGEDKTKAAHIEGRIVGEDKTKAAHIEGRIVGEDKTKDALMVRILAEIAAVNARLSERDSGNTPWTEEV